MYEAHYGLKERPFRKTPDPRYLFLNDVYEEALEQLLFAVEEMDLALLTGEVGSGKTLLTRALVDRVGDKYEIAMILNPRLSPRQFLHTLAGEIGVVGPRFHATDLVAQIHERLLQLDEAGRAALLIVDEAHLIPGKATFEEIRLLTNFQLDDRNLIAVLLVGQPELRERLRHRAYRALTQRIGAQFHLTPLGALDTLAYLRHRLTVAGATRFLFDERAALLLHEASGGLPRVLNQLATESLIEGMARGVAEIGPEVVEAVTRGRDFLEKPVLHEAGVGEVMGRMSEARKRARQKVAETDEVAADPNREAEGGSEPPGEAAASEAPLVFPAEAPSESVASSGDRFQLPSSGLAEDILGLQGASAFAADSPPTAAPVPPPGEETPSRGHTVSFFSAPGREERTAAEATEHLATFFLDREEYGVDVRMVQEIRRVTEITQVPRAPDFIKGVINLRGRIIPVIDLKRKLGLGDVIVGKLSRIVVVTIKGRLLGLLVDGASQVLKVPVSLVEPAPEEVVQKGGDYLRGVAKLEKRLIILVDLETVLALELREGSAAPA